MLISGTGRKASCSPAPPAPLCFEARNISRPHSISLTRPSRTVTRRSMRAGEVRVVGGHKRGETASLTSDESVANTCSAVFGIEVVGRPLASPCSPPQFYSTVATLPLLPLHVRDVALDVLGRLRIGVA
jgi:hypothetical protein